MGSLGLCAESESVPNKKKFSNSRTTLPKGGIQMGVCIPLPDIESLPDPIRDAVETFPLNYALMAANAPASFMALADLTSAIHFDSQIDRRKRLITSLRVAHVTDAQYMWSLNLFVARKVGITDDEIERIRTEDPVVSLGDEENLLCRVADEITRHVRLSDDALSQILNRYGTREATEIILRTCP